MERIVTEGGDLIFTSSYEEIAQRAQAARDKLSQRRIRLHQSSELSRLLQVASEMARRFAEGRAPADKRSYLRLSHCDRVADALLQCVDDRSAEELVRRMTSDSLNLSNVERSAAIDALWELELAAQMRRYNLKVEFGEPDLRVTLSGHPYAIACKKLYSQRSAGAQIAAGVRQLDKQGIGGIVAVNIDALCPPDSTLVSPDPEAAGAYLAERNRRFTDAVQPKIERYIISGRCDGLLVSTTAVCDLTETEHRLSTFRQVTMWSLSPPHHPFRPGFKLLAAGLGGDVTGPGRSNFGGWGWPQLIVRPRLALPR